MKGLGIALMTASISLGLLALNPLQHTEYSPIEATEIAQITLLIRILSATTFILGSTLHTILSCNRVSILFTISPETPQQIPQPSVYAIDIYLMSEQNSAAFYLQFTPEGATVAQEIISTFGYSDGQSVHIDSIQVASDSLRDKLDNLVTRHAKSNPHVHKLRKFVSQLRSNEHFLVLDHPPISTAERLDLESFIRNINHQDGTTLKATTESDLFHTVLERYNMDSPRTDRHSVIGNLDKAHRKCRFCGKTQAEGATFKSVAHAIPTALGNDHLKLADECDVCNGYFGRETEPSLVAFLNIQRAFLGIQGRGKNNGRPELRFTHGKLQHDGQRLNLASSQIVHDEKTGTFTIDLGKGAPFLPVAVYKALTKIALSVVDATQLPYLNESIQWVRYDKHANQTLPRIASAIVSLPPDPSAQIVVYRRIEENSRLPHIVGEFRLGCFMYVFVVPFSNRDSWNLVDFFDDEYFSRVFKHYKTAGLWKNQDLSGRNIVSTPSKIELVPRLKSGADPSSIS